MRKPYRCPHRRSVNAARQIVKAITERPQLIAHRLAALIRMREILRRDPKIHPCDLAWKLRLSRATVTRWAIAYGATGLEGLIPKKSPGRPRKKQSPSPWREIPAKIRERATFSAT